MMHRQTWARLLWVPAVLFSLASPPLVGDEAEVELQVTVSAEEDGAPIANASVYVKYKEARWLRKDKKREYRAKTNADGRAAIASLPAGEALIQAVAEGRKTYGAYHTLKGAKYALAVKLKKPKKWY